MTAKNNLPEQARNRLLTGGHSTRRTPSPTHDMERVFDELFRKTVGFEYLPSMFNKVSTSFPHYDIYKQDDNTYIVQIALAGYSPEDINVSQTDWELNISCSTPYTEEQNDNSGYLRKGIAKRSFSLKLPLGLHTEVTDAVMKDGMLHITVTQHDQDSSKPINVRKE